MEGKEKKIANQGKGITEEKIKKYFKLKAEKTTDILKDFGPIGKEEQEIERKLFDQLDRENIEKFTTNLRGEKAR